MSDALRAFYRRYNERCNRHEFGTLGDFVSEDVRVNDQATGLAAYVEGLRRVVDAFPDYRWRLRHLLVEGDLIAAHFADSGTHLGTFLGVPATGKRVATIELALYRIVGDKIADVWVTADDLALLEQIRSG